MREQDLIQRVNRTDELLHDLGWLARDEQLWIVKGSWTEKTPWGVGVETSAEDGTPVPLHEHTLFDKLPWSGVLGDSKREMGEALAVINALLVAFIKEKNA